MKLHKRVAVIWISRLTRYLMSCKGKQFFSLHLLQKLKGVETSQGLLQMLLDFLVLQTFFFNFIPE